MSFPRNGLARVENEKVKKEVAKPGAIFLPPLQLISRKNAANLTTKKKQTSESFDSNERKASMQAI